MSYLRRKETQYRCWNGEKGGGGDTGFGKEEGYRNWWKGGYRMDERGMLNGWKGGYRNWWKGDTEIDERGDREIDGRGNAAMDG